MGQTKSFADTLEQFNQQTDSTGGYIGKGKLEAGYKLFVKDLSNADSWFPYEMTGDKDQDELGRKKAIEAARQQLHLSGDPVGKNGKKINASAAVQITLYKNDVLGAKAVNAAGWQDDRVWTIAKWTDGYTKIVEPEFKRLIQEGKPISWGEMWMRVSFKPDPTGRQKADQNGEMKDELVAYIADVFVNEAAAELAATGTERVGERSNGHVVSDTLHDVDFIAAAKEAIAGKPKPKHNGILLHVMEEWEIADGDKRIAELRELVGLK